jgi:exonuclease SbcD
VSVGGLDSVEASAFDAFDYVALGHIHGAQRVRRDAVRYSGSLYPYSFSKAGRKKSCGIVEIDGSPAAPEGGRFRSYTPVELDEVRSLREVKCSFEELQAAAAADPHADDYLHVTLTDPALMNAMERVRALYPHVMQLDFDTGAQADKAPAARRARLATLDPIDLLEDFWQAQTGDALTSDMRAIALSLFQAEEDKDGAANATNQKEVGA